MNFQDLFCRRESDKDRGGLVTSNQHIQCINASNQHMCINRDSNVYLRQLFLFNFQKKKYLYKEQYMWWPEHSKSIIVTCNYHGNIVFLSTTLNFLQDVCMHA